jgi:hypothetical protein
LCNGAHMEPLEVTIHRTIAAHRLRAYSQTFRIHCA